MSKTFKLSSLIGSSKILVGLIPISDYSITFTVYSNQVEIKFKYLFESFDFYYTSSGEHVILCMLNKIVKISNETNLVTNYTEYEFRQLLSLNNS